MHIALYIITHLIFYSASILIMYNFRPFSTGVAHLWNKLVLLMINMKLLTNTIYRSQIMLYDIWYYDIFMQFLFPTVQLTSSIVLLVIKYMQVSLLRHETWIVYSHH